jgi:hypothetical protein
MLALGAVWVSKAVMEGPKKLALQVLKIERGLG